MSPLPSRLAAVNIGDDLRRALLVQQQLADRTSTRDIVGSLVALHATDPATVYLSVLARHRSASIDDVRSDLYYSELYDTGDLLRMMAMRRTVFVLDRDDVPMVHAAASLGVAATMRRALLKELATARTEPELADPQRWLDTATAAVTAHLGTVPAATGAQLGAAVEELRVAVLPATDKAWDRKQLVTSRVLTLLGTEGVIVRATPPAKWTSRQHQWASIERWWPGGIPEIDPKQARVDLARRWLERFGPATADDLQWWTGWTKTATAAALKALAPDEVELACGPGYALPETLAQLPTDPAAVVEDSIRLLPALDPTPMGWRHRDWYLGEHREALFDRFGNIGPTIWLRGRIVGGWAVRGDGTVATELLEKVNARDQRRIDNEVERLNTLLGGTPVTPAFPTPLERTLRTG